MKRRSAGAMTVALSAIADGSPIGMAATEGSAHLVRYANPAMCRLIGLPSDNVLGRPLSEVVPEAQAPMTRELLDNVVQSGMAEHAIDVGTAQHGTSGPYWTYSVWPILGNDQQSAGLLVEISDTTDQVHEREERSLDATTEIRDVNHLLLIAGLDAQAHVQRVEALNTALRESEARLRLATDIAQMYVWEVDLQSRQIQSSQNFTRITGRQPPASYDDILTTVHPDDREQLAHGLDDAIKTSGTLDFEVRFLTPDNRVDWYHVSVMIMTDANGEPRRALGVSQNISARKTAENELRASEERYRTLFEAMDEGFCILQKVEGEEGAPLDFRFIEVNPAFAAHSGVSGVVGNTIRQKFPSEPQHWYDTYDTVLRTGQPIRSVREFMTQGRTLDLYAFRVGKEAEHRVAVLFKDVTERIAAEEARDHLLDSERAARTEAEEAVRVRDRFLSIASHELRTPVAGVSGLAQLISRRAQRRQFADGRLELLIRHLDDAARRLVTLTNDLLDVARLQEGHLPLRLRPTQLETLTREVVAEMGRRPGPARQILVTVSGTLSEVALDPDRFRQVISNLLDNAVKYSPDGGAILVDLRRDGHDIRLAVTDTGIGLPADTAETIFEPFGRASNAESSNIPGMGLGLHISRQIVELHSGRIWAESNGDGQGATFFVSLPAGRPPT